MRRTLLAGLASLVLATTFLSGGASTAAAHSRLGEGRAFFEGPRLYWSQAVDLDFSAIHIVTGDVFGNHVHALTHPAPGVQDIDPKVSPGGNRVLFERDRPDTSVAGVVHADGGGEHVLRLPCTDPCVGVQAPTWTPDGRHVVFTRVIGPFPNDNATSAVLWKSNLDGSHLVRLSEPGIDGTFEDYNATFAPGGYIVFLRLRNAGLKSAAFRMDADGSHVRRLTPWYLDADELSASPAQSGPSKDLVVFETYGHGQPDGVAQAVATVSARSRCGHGCTGHIDYLTWPGSLPVQHFNPAWSPNGRKIAYVKFSYVESRPVPVHGDIWRMRWNGTHKPRVSHSPLFEFRPAWGPHLS